MERVGHYSRGDEDWLLVSKASHQICIRERQATVTDMERHGETWRHITRQGRWRRGGGGGMERQGEGDNERQERHEE